MRLLTSRSGVRASQGALIHPTVNCFFLGRQNGINPQKNDFKKSCRRLRHQQGKQICASYIAKIRTSQSLAEQIRTTFRRSTTHSIRRRPYRVEYTGSLLTSEVKRRKARLVLGWGTAREDLRVLSAFIGAPYALCVCRVNIALQLDTDPVWSVYIRMSHAEMKLDAA